MSDRLLLSLHYYFFAISFGELYIFVFVLGLLKCFKKSTILDASYNVEKINIILCVCVYSRICCFDVIG